MKVPFYERVHLPIDIQREEVAAFLSDLPLRVAPIALIIDRAMGDIYAQEILDEISSHLIRNRIDLRAPYPIYLVSPFVNLTTPLRQFEKLEELPKYFWPNRKELFGREIGTLKRIEFIQEKFKSLYLAELLEKMRELHSDDFKKRYFITDQRHYFESLKDQLARVKKRKYL
jgi:hypothetical protein